MIEIIVEMKKKLRGGGCEPRIVVIVKMPKIKISGGGGGGWM